MTRYVCTMHWPKTVDAYCIRSTSKAKPLIQMNQKDSKVPNLPKLIQFWSMIWLIISFWTIWIILGQFKSFGFFISDFALSTSSHITHNYAAVCVLLKCSVPVQVCSIESCGLCKQTHTSHLNKPNEEKNYALVGENQMCEPYSLLPYFMNIGSILTN